MRVQKGESSAADEFMTSVMASTPSAVSTSLKEKMLMAVTKLSSTVLMRAVRLPTTQMLSSHV